MYTDSVNLTYINAFDILYAAKKYMLPVLEGKCSRYLRQSVNPSNACFILERAMFFSDSTMQLRSKNTIMKKTRDALKSDCFREISHSTLCAILEFDSFSVEEIDIFNACLDWAKTECDRQDLHMYTSTENMRNVLGGALYLIRIPTIPSDDFENIVVKSGVLRQEEVDSIYEYHTSNENDDDVKEVAKFSTVKRRTASAVHDSSPISFLCPKCKSVGQLSYRKTCVRCGLAIEMSTLLK